MQAWDNLASEAKKVEGRSILSLFDDNDRFQDFSITLDDFLLDYSKTNLDSQVRSSLIALLQERGVEEKRDAMFQGEKINDTEGRAVLHTALRNQSGNAVYFDGQDIMPEIKQTLDRMSEFANQIRSGKTSSATNEKFTDVVNIGIGGSDLGPAMACLALAPYHDGPRTHFVSNVDGAHIADTLKNLDPTRTLVIIASKTFTTIETMTNARAAIEWLENQLGDKAPLHLAALSSAEDKTAALGINPARVFGFEDWVGGRYSLWGPIGLSIMMAIGPNAFKDFLCGAEEMDNHFKTAPLEKNLPAMLAAIGIWHSNFCGYDTRAVLPYDQRLSRLPAYLQQLDMESNGKSVGMDGQSLSQESGPIVWGEPGTNGQHAFYQLIHQGTRVIPCEFLVARNGHEDALSHHHDLLLANCLAQSEALMIGRDFASARELMEQKGFEGAELERQASHRVFNGNRPSITMMYDKLTPKTLGRIIALYEHRVFVEGVVWGLNSFDQWGVELGKELAVALLPILQGEQGADDKDGSTAGLVRSVQSLG